MGNSGEKNLGQEIQTIVQDAVKNMDFQGLNREIGNTARIAIDDIRRNINSQPEQFAANIHGKDRDYKIIRDANGRYQKIRTGTAEMMESARQQARQTQQRVSQRPNVSQTQRQASTDQKSCSFG